MRTLQERATERVARPATLPTVTTLERLEAEGFDILWTTRAEFHSAAIMFSAGKDSACVLHLAEKAFRTSQGRLEFPFSLIHYDSGANFPEVLRFRQDTAARLGADLKVFNLHSAATEGIVTAPLDTADDPGNVRGLVQLINYSAQSLGVQALIGGGRRDEELVRAKERIFSLRNSAGQWDPHAQRPEPWSLYNTTLRPGEHMRVFPISNWTERNVWEYIAQEQIALPSIYYAHERAVVRRNGGWLAVFPDTKLREGERIERRVVRCRTVGDRHTTGFIESDATTPLEVLEEILRARTSERAGRVEDNGTGTDMESRKRLGWP
jgi:sulfate adenylyltransferase subunit 2